MRRLVRIYSAFLYIHVYSSEQSSRAAAHTDNTEATPTKTPTKKRVGKKAADVSDEEDAGSAKKKRKTPVKKAKAAAVKAEDDEEGAVAGVGEEGVKAEED